MSKKLEIQLVIPDSGVLISLAHGDLLDVLFSFTDDVRLEITDVVEFEVTRKSDLFDAKRINAFLSKHAGRIKVAETSFHDFLDPNKKLPANIGEVSIYGYINDIRRHEPGIPTLIIFEDKWFVDNQYNRPRNTHLISLTAFLKFLENVVPSFSFDEAMNRIRHTRPTAAATEIDIPADSRTAWKPKIRRPGKS